MPTCEAGGSVRRWRRAPFLLLLGRRAPPIERPVCIEINPTELAVSELRSPDIRLGPGGDATAALIRCPATTRTCRPASWAYPFFTMSSRPLPVAAEPVSLFDLGRFAQSGGARRDRTDDLLLAKQALSQLSYGPVQVAEPEVSVDAAAGGRKCVETRRPHPRSRISSISEVSDP
jgi:hypothetical protein